MERSARAHALRHGPLAPARAQRAALLRARVRSEAREAYAENGSFGLANDYIRVAETCSAGPCLRWRSRCCSCASCPCRSRCGSGSAVWRARTQKSRPRTWAGSAARGRPGLRAWRSRCRARTSSPPVTARAPSTTSRTRGPEWTTARRIVRLLVHNEHFENHGGNDPETSRRGVGLVRADREDPPRGPFATLAATVAVPSLPRSRRRRVTGVPRRGTAAGGKADPDAHARDPDPGAGNDAPALAWPRTRKVCAGGRALISGSRRGRTWVDMALGSPNVPGVAPRAPRP